VIVAIVAIVGGGWRFAIGMTRLPESGGGRRATGHSTPAHPVSTWTTTVFGLTGKLSARGLATRCARAFDLAFVMGSVAAKGDSMCATE
jgi:hypothetical protein